MIRILHTADWHLGQTFFGYDRTAEHEHFLEWLAEEIEMQEADVLIIAGDVFDVANPSAASQQMFYRLIRRITSANPDVQLVVVAGNHDSAARLETPLPLLQELNTTIKGSVRKKNGEIDYDDLLVTLHNKEGEAEALCLAVPFLRQGDYPAVEVEQGNPYTEGVREFYNRFTQHALQKRTAGQALVAVGHLQATGSEIAEKDHSERTIIGGLEAVSPDAFPPELVYVALGHIHKSQRVSGREQVRYAGSPLSMSFAEKHYKHGVELITIDKGELLSIEKREYTPLVSLLSLSFDTPELVSSLSGQLEGLSGSADYSSGPYLEIRVQLTEPEPMLRQRVEEALEGKGVRLARIVSTYKQTGEGAEEEIYAAGLQEMTPLQIVKRTFEKTYQSEMPDELLELFQEAALALYNENSTGNS